jgi:hypothetical protein
MSISVTHAYTNTYIWAAADLLQLWVTRDITMMDEFEQSRRDEPQPAEEETAVDNSPTGGIRVYNRPAPRSPVLLYVIVFLILAIVTAVLFFQFIR